MITVDFGTLFDEIMPEFDCDCGAPSCRGRVRGSDWRGDTAAAYGEHVAPYLRRRRGE